MASDKYINELANHTTPLDTDIVPIYNTANSSTKGTTWANIKATLKAYFDTLYNNYVLTKAAVEAVLTGVISTHSHSVSKSDVGLGNCDNTSDANKPVSTPQQTALNFKLDASLKGSSNGLAELDSVGKVPSSQLPSYVDDVLEYANLATFPAVGETGKIYIALDTNITYRWSGSIYAEMSSGLALGETPSTAYRGDRGKTAYDHSQVTGNPHGATQDNIPDGTTNKQYSATEKTKLSGIETGATANTKATGAELDTGTDDSKFATAKALKDSHNVPSVSPGTLGNVLTSNGTDWTSAAPSGGGGEPETIKGASTSIMSYSDDLSYLPAYISAGSALYLLPRQLISGDIRYRAGNQQLISKSTLWADTDTISYPMVVGGYVYAFLLDNGVAAKVIRCAVTSDISVIGNWAELTISGTALPTSTNSGMVGYGDGKFWFVDNSNAKLIPYTLSGTTLTSASDVTITGATYEATRFRVNSNGIYCRFSSAPYIRFAAFDGTLNTDKQFLSSDTSVISALSDSFYVYDSTHYVKID